MAGGELHTGHRLRIKERYLKKGIMALDDKDLVELILTYTIPRKDVYEIARGLVHEFGSAESLLAAEPEELRARGKLTEHTIVLLKLINDVRTKPYRSIVYRRERLTSVLRTAEYCHSLLGGYPDEVVILLYIDSNDYVTDLTKVSYGTADSAVLPVDEIVARTMHQNAKRVVIAHNHPSGSSTPSSADIRDTEALRAALFSHGIELAEHIIVSKTECTAVLHHQTINVSEGRATAPWK